jgi:hypothetical protein
MIALLFFIVMMVLYTVITEGPGVYRRLEKLVDDIDLALGTANRVYK